MIYPGARVYIPIADGQGELVTGSIEFFLARPEFDEVHGYTRWFVGLGTLSRPGEKDRTALPAAPGIGRSGCQFRAYSGITLSCRGRSAEAGLVSSINLRHYVLSSCRLLRLWSNEGGRTVPFRWQCKLVRFSTPDCVMQDVSLPWGIY